MAKTFFLVLMALITLPATPSFAEGWSRYENQRFGAVADIPPGFAPVGPEAKNSDGLIFRARTGRALLTVFGADVPGADFDTYVKKLMARDRSYSGWTIRKKTVTPRWAEYSGSNGPRQLRVRAIAACGGQIVLAAKIEFGGSMDAVVSRLFRSLHADPDKRCR